MNNEYLVLFLLRLLSHLVSLNDKELASIERNKEEKMEQIKARRRAAYRKKKEEATVKQQDENLSALTISGKNDLCFSTTMIVYTPFVKQYKVNIFPCKSTFILVEQWSSDYVFTLLFNQPTQLGPAIHHCHMMMHYCLLQLHSRLVSFMIKN